MTANRLLVTLASHFTLKVKYKSLVVKLVLFDQNFEHYVRLKNFKKQREPLKKPLNPNLYKRRFR